jgi:transketolase
LGDPALLQRLDPEAKQIIVTHGVEDIDLTWPSNATLTVLTVSEIVRVPPMTELVPAHPAGSKGHAAPLLYAAWAEAGALSRDELSSLRKLDSNLEGHPTPRLPFVKAATKSLGQGLSVAAGMAFDCKVLRKSGQRVYTLIGDGESAEGSVWEAAQWASFRRLDNLCAAIDINGLGQSQKTMYGHDLDAFQRRWEAFGWQAIPVDGHDVGELLQAYRRAADTRDRPTVILARTIKGKGLGSIEGDEHWHGKALDRDAAERVISDLKQRITRAHEQWQPNLPSATPPTASRSQSGAESQAKPPYEVGGKDIATRKGFGDGLAALAAADDRVVVIDGDVKNSTHTEEFEKAAPERFVQAYIAEQNMAGLAMGLAARGRTPFVSTFACFLTRPYDFIRMTAISGLNVKFAGTHAGVSIGEDGPSQMGLEDLAMMAAQPNFTVLYPSDATSAWRAAWLLAAHAGPCYLRLGRPSSPILYGRDEAFAVGKCKVLRKSAADRALIVAAGVTVKEALRAHDVLRDQGVPVRVIDLFSVQPIDREALIASARDVGGLVLTVEDHYEHGGIGDAVFTALAAERVRGHKLAIRGIPRSGKPDELMSLFGIDFRQIVETVRSALV